MPLDTPEGELQRSISARSPGWAQFRGHVRMEPGSVRQGQATEVHALHASDADSPSDIPSSEPANTAAGQKFLTMGYDLVTVVVEGNLPNAVTDLFIAPQGASGEDDEDATWMDVYEDEAGDGVLVKKTYEYTPGGTGEFRFMFDMRVTAPWTRFKVWGAGTMTDSRVSIRIIRKQQYR